MEMLQWLGTLSFHSYDLKRPIIVEDSSQETVRTTGVRIATWGEEMVDRKRTDAKAESEAQKQTGVESEALKQTVVESGGSDRTKDEEMNGGTETESVTSETPKPEAV
jgi:hypothetical protein